MNEKAQELYETYEAAMCDQGVSVDDWHNLDGYDKRAWSALADCLEQRGWQGA